MAAVGTIVIRRMGRADLLCWISPLLFGNSGRNFVSVEAGYIIFTEVLQEEGFGFYIGQIPLPCKNQSALEKNLNLE